VLQVSEAAKDFQEYYPAHQKTDTCNKIGKKTHMNRIINNTIKNLYFLISNSIPFYSKMPVICYSLLTITWT
jgi:hypothetical protein